MQEMEFNLLDEPWIRVRRGDCVVEEVSLTDALLNAHLYQDLAGETPTQDAAMLRLLLAVLHSVFFRVDENGQDAPLTSVDGALIRWGQLWSKGYFEEKPIRDYLTQWHERFWLFHPDRPFWQVASVRNGIVYSAAMLNGELSQGEHRDRVFSSYAGEDKEKLTYSQAARWLIHLNAYDVRGGRPKEGNKPRHGVSWLGQLGYVCIRGSSLYETLMMNLVLAKDKSSVWGAPNPCWELDRAREEQSVCLGAPDNQAELLTMQSRRILLRRDDKHEVVIGCELLGGDYIEENNAFVEQMTIWQRRVEKNSEIYYYKPFPHDTTKQLWREIPALLREDTGKLPGVIEWNRMLKEADILPGKQVVILRAIGMKYDSQGASHKEIYADTLAMVLSVLSNLKRWGPIITAEENLCEQIADAIFTFGKELALAGGADLENKTQWETRGGAARDHFYYDVDQPFRDWIQALSPDWEVDELDTSRTEWRRRIRTIACQVANESVQLADGKSMIGHKIKTENKKESRTYYYSAPLAYNNFMRRLNYIFKDERLGDTNE